jgi:hypothetical protein
MYFSFLPYVKYDQKPINFPFSEADYVVVKNFFRRYTLSEDAFSYATFFKKYSIQDEDRLDTLAERAYGNPFYDWIIVLTNSLVNPIYDWPLSENDLRKQLEAEYDDPYSTIKYYRTYEVTTDDGDLALQGGLIVDENFYNTQFKYWDKDQVKTLSGADVSYPVTIFEHESEKNEEKREIYLLKPKYVDAFVDDFRKNNLYKPCSAYISNQLKLAGI